MNFKSKGSKKSYKKKATAVVSDAVGNYEKHPFFVKKAAAAKALLDKVGLPRQLSKKVPA